MSVQLPLDLSIPVEWPGIWFLPSDRDNEVAGVMRWRPGEGISLDLIGSFFTGDDAFDAALSKPDAPYPIVLGYLRQGGQVTLMDCHTVGMPFSTNGFVSQNLRAFDGALVGHHFQSAEELRFNVLSLEFDSLFEWCGVSGIEFQIEVEGAEEKHRSTTLTYRTPPKLEATWNNSRITITSGYRTSGMNSPTSTISETLRLKVETGHDLTLNDLSRSFFGPLQDLLTLGVGRPSPARSFSVSSPAANVDATGPAKLLGYLRPFTVNPDSSRTNFLRWDMLFALPDFESGFDALIPVWLQLSEDLKTSFNIVFGSRHTPPKLLESRFLLAAQSVEVYHRLRYPETEMDPNKFKTMIKRLIKMNPEDADWLKEKLKWANELPMRSRLEKLAGIASFALEPFLGSSRDFARRVAHSRNYYTHYGTRTKHVLEGEALHWLTTSLAYLIDIVLLLEIGFTEAKVLELLARNFRFQQSMGRAKASIEAHYGEGAENR